MLTALAIRDVVLIERLDLSFGCGLTVLTGETGAGKSILLDSLGLALGMRADGALVRPGAQQASVTACFACPPKHAIAALMAEHGIDPGDEIVLRRVVGKDGRSRAFVNDQPVGVGLLRRAGALLVEIQGQHEQMGLSEASTHAWLLDEFGVPSELRFAISAAWRAWRRAIDELEAARESAAAAQRDEDWLRHAVDELARLAPREAEEERLAEERTRLQQNERRAEAIASALGELVPRDRRGTSPAAALRAASRALQRAVQPGSDGPGIAGPALSALERAEEAVADAEALLTRLGAEADDDPRRLEETEERLFALRAAARKHGVLVAELPSLLDTLSVRLAGLEASVDEIRSLEAAAIEARQAYATAASALSGARRTAAQRLNRAVTGELGPLRLDKARFHADIGAAEEPNWGPSGTDAVRFLIATNPGQELGSLNRIASGGELSRLMLALKVVLSAGSAVTTLVFDEVDSGVGGATAAAVGDRLARVAERMQVLVVTHSPQVAARGAVHFRVLKSVARGRAVTRVDGLDAKGRREEIARMLAGERVTEAARAAAADLLGAPA